MSNIAGFYSGFNLKFTGGPEPITLNRLCRKFSLARNFGWLILDSRVVELRIV
jgi:hypothetical protein